MFLTLFFECPEKFFYPLNSTLTEFFLATGRGGEVDEKIFPAGVQGIIDFRRAILADPPPPLKGASFAPVHGIIITWL